MESQSLLNNENLKKKINQFTSNTNFQKKYWIFFFSLTILSLLFFGTIFFSWYHGWERSTSFYFTCSALTGSMNGVPEQTNDQLLSITVTMFLYLTGISFISVISGHLLSRFITSPSYWNVKRYTKVVIGLFQNQRQISRHTSVPKNIKELDDVSIVNNTTRNFFVHHREKIIIFSITWLWFIVGILYALTYERFDFFHSIYYALGALSSSGYPNLPCIGGMLSSSFHITNNVEKDSCVFGNRRAIFSGTYLLLGIPLFNLCIGFITGWIIKTVISNKNMKILTRPVTKEEFLFAASIFGTKRNLHPTCPIEINCQVEELENLNLNLAEFILLELIRLKRVEMKEILYLKQLYSYIDEDESGYIDYFEIKKYRDKINTIIKEKENSF